MDFFNLYILMGVFYLPMMALYVFCIVLFVKLALRGIKALDIYIDKNREYLK